MTGQSNQEPPGDDGATRLVDADSTRLSANPPEQSTPAPASPTGQTTMLGSGEVLRERYSIVRMLGEGGMGQVYLAQDLETDDHVAIKTLGAEFQEHPQSLAALRREARQCQRLNHPNIVNVFYFERTEPHVFMVMEYMQGASLDDYLEQSGPAPLSTVLPIIKDCAAGLQYIHDQRIIHSDFKPGNVFLTRDGTVKVLDLGIARSVDETNAARGTTRFDPDALGAMTPAYASCEMFEGLTPTEQDDLFAFGIVIYELLTGEHPFPFQKFALDARAAGHEPARPEGLDRRPWKALKAALSYGRADRPATVQAFFEEFAPQSRSPVLWISAAVAAVVLAVVLGGTTFLMMESDDEIFVNRTLVQFPSGPDPAAPASVENWLEQGDFFLDMGRKSLLSGDIDRAISQLITSPSSAFQSFRLALSKSDDVDLRNRAALGMLSISTTFKTKAEELYAQEDVDLDLVAKSTCSVLNINAQDADMLELLRSLDDQMVNRVSSVGECRRLIESGRVSV